MLKLVIMPPQNDLQRQWAPRLQCSLPDYRVVVPETAVPPHEAHGAFHQRGARQDHAPG